MVINSIINYFQSNNYKTFFAIVGDTEYNNTLNQLGQLDVDYIRLSDFCYGDDKYPDLDSLYEHLLTADIDCKSSNVVVLGLGEWLALQGKKRSCEVLNYLKDFKTGTAHIVFLLRYIKSEILTLAKNDLRFDERRYFISNNYSDSSIKLIFAVNQMNVSDIRGIKGLIKTLEDGNSGKVIVNTSLKFPDSDLNIKTINNHYDAIVSLNSGFKIDKSIGSDANWEFLYNEIKENYNLEDIFNNYKFIFDEQDFFKNLYGDSDINWLYYVFLIEKMDSINNEYIKYCLQKHDSFDDFKSKFLSYIIGVSHDSKIFSQLYSDRKKIIRFYPASEIALFISENRINIKEEIYKLTDSSKIEKEEIISYIAQNGLFENLENIYPDLYYYGKNYNFLSTKPNDFGQFLTDYFAEYKKCKLLNIVSPKIIEYVEKEAVQRNYNRLATRDTIVNKYDKQENFLCWIDALGVEYLSFIVEKAKKYGLMINAEYGRAELPTITSINKGFYNNWKNNKKKIELLDDLKHDDKGGFFYGENNKYSIHLASELEVIDNVLLEAVKLLSLGTYSNYIIASDHGSSRLAVLYNKEEKYETDTQGEHSGRCCKKFEGYDLNFATEENGYIVLADYGRFKGSRAANVEVHGGATIEEVVVPIISLSLKDKTVKVSIVDEYVKVDYKTPASFIVFINKSLSSITLRFNSKEYIPTKVDDNHYKFVIEEIRKAGKYQLDIFSSNSLLSRVELTTKGKSASVNDDFDF